MCCRRVLLFQHSCLPFLHYLRAAWPLNIHVLGKPCHDAGSTAGICLCLSCCWWCGAVVPGPLSTNASCYEELKATATTNDDGNGGLQLLAVSWHDMLPPQGDNGAYLGSISITMFHEQ